jgi:hypothetical protein
MDPIEEFLYRCSWQSRRLAALGRGLRPVSEVGQDGGGPAKLIVEEGLDPTCWT